MFDRRPQKQPSRELCALLVEYSGMLCVAMDSIEAGYADNALEKLDELLKRLERKIVENEPPSETPDWLLG